jgi:glyoxylase-like metal-dependent hydrolase (beta-lactamase superfamily II)
LPHRIEHERSLLSKLRIFEAMTDVWCVRRGDAAAYVVKLSPGAVLIDAGPDPSGRDVMMGLQSARVGLASVRAILLTHAHPHAAAGARALAERSGAPLYASRLESRRLDRPESPGWLARWRGARSRPALSVDVELEGSERIFERFVALATPGPTEGHLAFYDEVAGVLFAGDALLERGAELPEAAGRSAARCRAQQAAVVLPALGEPLRAGR